MKMDLPCLGMAANNCRRALFFLYLFFPLALSAQQNPLHRRVTLDLNQVRLDDALFALGAAADFDFSYNTRVLPADSLVSVFATEASVRKVLNSLIGPGYVVKPLGNHLVIAPRAKTESLAATTSHWVEGYLIDAQTGEKVRFATVYAGPKSVGTTDSAGHYRINFQANTREVPISFSKRGFNDTVVVIRPDRSPALTVGIRPKPNYDIPLASREVSVVGDMVEPPFPLEDWFVSIEQQALAANLEDPIKTFPVQISLLPAIGTNRLLSGGMQNNLSINVLAGYSNGVRGLEVGGLANIDREDVLGCQVAGLANVVGGHVRGLQAAGLVNHVRGEFRGLQVAGLVNYNQGQVRGIQVAGLVNFSPQPVQGVQISGLVGYAFGDVTHFQVGGLVCYAKGNVGGCQIGGLASYAKGNVGGFQIGGLASYAQGNAGGLQIGGLVAWSGGEVRTLQVAGLASSVKGDVRGLQLSGISNRAKGDVHGFQLSGIANKAKVLHGLQVGLVNIADSSAGIQLGLVNIVRKGYRALEFSGNEVFQTHLVYKTGRRGFYNFMGGGYRFGPRTQALSYGVGMGTSFVSGPMSLGLELACYHVAESHFGFRQLNLLVPARIHAGIQLGRVEFFGGGGVTTQVTGAQNSAGEFRTQLAPRVFWRNDGQGTRVQAWIGWQAGLRIGLWPKGERF